MFSKSEIRILFVEDNHADARFIQELLHEAKRRGVMAQQLTLHHADTLATGLKYLLTEPVDVVLLDLFLPDGRGGVETFRQLASNAPETPIIVLTGLDDQELGLSTIKEGAQDYLVKGEVNEILLVRTIRYAIERKRVQNELAVYQLRLEELVIKRTSELKDSQAQLRAAERLASIGTLAAGIAHEINNPIGAILLSVGNALELESKTENERAYQRALRKIFANGERCAQIVKSILQFARQEKTQKWPNEITDLVKRAVQLSREYLKDYRPQIELLVEDNLPQVLLNPTEIEQVLINLIKNAIQASGENPKVTVRAAHYNSGISLSVEDQGKGISEADQQRIFDPFYTTRQHTGGTGLGLSMVHGIIQAHGGSLALFSALGKGTTITIYLPQALEEQKTLAG